MTPASSRASLTALTEGLSTSFGSTCYHDMLNKMVMMMMMMPQIISSITDYQRRPCHQGLSSHSLQGKRPTKPEHFRPWRRKGICANLFLFSRPKTNTGRAHSKSILNHISHMCYERKKLESKIHVKLIRTEKNVRPNICYIFEKLRVQGCQI